MVRCGVWSVGTSGPLGSLVRWDIWSIGTFDLLGHIDDDERLALVKHQAIKRRLVCLSSTSGPKGHLRQRERWYIWRREAHMVHLALEGASSTSGTSMIGREDSSQVEIC
ncbi:hypothetical protein F2Q69_00022047 [Brassica cretica]|uniref:Uncharacterized protein n=1 Tax=Brassica cretica TaxID=69181 RepID=A0A8S9Q9E2_BRACR|nr:hypothetical protein F2Q69_00022047 [Brassica cretica]